MKTWEETWRYSSSDGIVRTERGKVVTILSSHDYRERLGELIAQAPAMARIALLIYAAEQSPTSWGKTGFTRPTQRQWEAIVTAARQVLRDAGVIE